MANHLIEGRRTKRLTAERIGKLRGVLRVARTFLSKTLTNRPERWVILDGNSEKTWRRAYVETALTARPAECVISDGVSVLEVMGEAHAIATGGRVLTVKRLGTDPATIGALAAKVGEQFFNRVAARVRELEPEVAAGRTGSIHVLAPLMSMKIRWARPFVIGAMKRFLAQVDPDAVRMARRYWLTSPECLTWLTPSSPDMAKRRRQAVELYPALIVNARPWENSHIPSSVARAIDAGQPLVEALAKHYGVRPATIRWFAGRSPQSLFRRLSGLKEKLPMRALDILPSPLMPSCRADMEAAVRLNELLTAVGGGTKHPIGSANEPLQPDFNVRSFMKRIPCAIPLREQPVISSEMHTKQVIDTVYDAKTYAKNAEATFAEMGLSALDKLSTDWHRAVVVESTKSVSDATWEPGFEDMDIHEGDLRLVELTTASQLTGEGVFLSHCVGTYAPACLQGRSRIISIRNALGMPSSTIEINRKGQIVQHCGYRNGAPSKVEVKLAKRLVAEIRAGKVKIKDWPMQSGSYGMQPSLNMAPFWATKGMTVSAEELEREDCPF